MSNNDVYACGWVSHDDPELESVSDCTYIWKNGEVLWQLEGGGPRFNSIAVLGRSGDVYAGGHETLPGTWRVATIWKNGAVLWRLTDGANSAGVNSIFVKESQ
jgi:hypothetical protein